MPLSETIKILLVNRWLIVAEVERRNERTENELGGTVGESANKRTLYNAPGEEEEGDEGPIRAIVAYIF